MTEDTLGGVRRINLDEIGEVVESGVRRAAAFLRLGLDDLDQRGKGDFNLTALTTYLFWPADISEEVRSELREEYRFWVVGSCLRELDHFYSIFLDRVWVAIQVAELNGTLVSPEFEFDPKFSKDTNVANKQRKVRAKLGTPDHFDELNSLSLARNALTHFAGIVRSPTDCNDETREALELQWLALDPVIRVGEKLIPIEKMPFDTAGLPTDVELSVGVHVVNRKAVFAKNSKLELTEAQLAELCLFYHIVGAETMKALVEFYRSKGILLVENEAASEPTPDLAGAAFAKVPG